MNKPTYLVKVIWPDAKRGQFAVLAPGQGVWIAITHPASHILDLYPSCAVN